MTKDGPHILIVDDERDIREPLARYLRKHGFRVATAKDGRDMDQVLAASRIDLIILDIMMPGEDGFSICRRLQETTQVPVILLTALVEDTDRIVGLELGSDDYVSKPFNPRELIARIKSVLRRSRMLPQQQITPSGRVKFGRWVFDFTRKEVVASDHTTISLSSSEHTLLITLIKHCGMTLSRDQLLDLTKGREAQLFDRSIDNQISRLRHKLEDNPQNPEIILTQWGQGYLFAADIEDTV